MVQGEDSHSEAKKKNLHPVMLLHTQIPVSKNQKGENKRIPKF